MEQSELLRFVVETFERLNIAYFVTGSVATVFYGEPRFTNDIDVVAEIGPLQISHFVKSFPADRYYISEDAAREAIRSHGQFNIIHPASGFKVGVIIPDESPFYESRFARARRVQPEPGLDVNFSTPEDVILKKLDFHRIGGSEKHLRDITGVLKFGGSSIDRAYIERWADRLGLRELWNSVIASMSS